MNFLSGQTVVSKGRICDGDLKRSDVESCHVILAASFILIVDDVLSDVILGSWILDLSFSSPVVDHKDKDQHLNRDPRINNVQGEFLQETCIINSPLKRMSKLHKTEINLN